MPDSWLTDAFDQHADRLYIYSRFLLRDPDDAADAVEHTFLVAAARPADLPGADRTRAWLFALLRNECLRQIRSGRAVPATSPGAAGPRPGLTVGDPDPALVRAAIRDLSPAEADVIGLFWHGLEVPEIAEVLDLPRHEALAVFSRARDQLEASLTGPGRRLSPAELSNVQLSLTPGALLSAAITPEGMRYAARVTGALRDQLLDAAEESATPGSAGHRMARRAGPFRGNGFPAPLSTGRGRKPRRVALAALGAVAVAVAVAGVLDGERGQTNAGLDVQARPTGLTMPSLATLSPVKTTSATPSPSPSASPSASPSPSVTSASPVARPPTSRASAKASAPSASGSASAASAAAAGKLLVSPTTVTVSNGNPAWLTLTATGGAISWSITSSARHLSLSPTSGTLQSGQSATIKITTTRWTVSRGTLTVTGGGQSQQVTVNGG